MAYNIIILLTYMYNKKVDRQLFEFGAWLVWYVAKVINMHVLTPMSDLFCLVKSLYQANLPKLIYMHQNHFYIKLLG